MLYLLDVSQATFQQTITIVTKKANIYDVRVLRCGTTILLPQLQLLQEQLLMSFLRRRLFCLRNVELGESITSQVCHHAALCGQTWRTFWRNRSTSWPWASTRFVRLRNPWRLKRFARFALFNSFQFLLYLMLKLNLSSLISPALPYHLNGTKSPIYCRIAE